MPRTPCRRSFYDPPALLERCFAVDIQLSAYLGKVNQLTLLDGPQGPFAQLRQIACGEYPEGLLRGRLERRPPERLSPRADHVWQTITSTPGSFGPTHESNRLSHWLTAIKLRAKASVKTAR